MSYKAASHASTATGGAWIVRSVTTRAADKAVSQVRSHRSESTPRCRPAFQESTVSADPALVLAPEAPYPLRGGGALRTASLIQYLARTRPVDLILFRQPGTPDPAAQLPAGLVRRVSVIQLPPTGRGLAARAVRNSGRLARRVPPLVDRFAGFQREVAQAIGGSVYEIGLIEHSWCAPYWEQISPACQRTVLDLHNIESLLHARCAAVEGPATALAHRIFRDASLTGARLAAALLTGADHLSERRGRRAGHRAHRASRSIPNALPWVPQPWVSQAQARG